MPRLGRITVDKISTSDVLAVLVPIWSDKRETAMKIRRRISAVMRWAIAEGYRNSDPADSAIQPSYPRLATELLINAPYRLLKWARPLPPSESPALGRQRNWPLSV